MNVDGRAAGVDISAHLLELSRVTLLDNATDPFKMLAMLALGLRDRDEDFKITPDQTKPSICAASRNRHRWPDDLKPRQQRAPN